MRKHCRQLNTSVGVSERYDFAVRAPRRSSFGVARVHRIPLRVRDDREPPLLVERDGAENAGDLGARSMSADCGRLARRANQRFAAAGPAGTVKITAP